MSVDWQLVGIIAAPTIALVAGAILDRVLERRPKLITYIGHVSAFNLKGPNGDTPVHTHSVAIWNAGRKPAKNVKLGHYYLPDFRLNPSVECTVESLPSGGEQILIPTLVPKEQVTISYLYFPPVLWNMVNSYIKSDDGPAQAINVLPSRQYPKWMQRGAAVLLLLGVIATLYLLTIAAISLF